MTPSTPAALAALGKDTACTDRLRTGRYSTGLRLVGEAIFRRLTTPRGMLRGGEDEGIYGLDLAGRIGTIASEADAAALQAQIRTECMKDDRIVDAAATVTATTTGPSTSYAIAVVCDVDDGGSFTLTMAASAVTVELLGLTTSDGS